MADVRTETMPKGGEFPFRRLVAFKLESCCGQDDLWRTSKPCRQR